jgi:hypothetical protein
MGCQVYCNNVVLENVSEFKYLGLVINRNSSSPECMLLARIKKAQGAFNSVKCKGRLLGLFNRRVRV